MSAQAAGSAKRLTALPLANLVLAHAVEDAVLMVDAEEAGWEPPLDGSTNRGAAAPALGIATTTQVARVMNALNERPTHFNPIRNPTRSPTSKGYA
jgi:hypothetical protein